MADATPADTAVADARTEDAPAPMSANEAGADRGPDLLAPDDSSIMPGPRLDGGPPAAGGVCVLNSDCPLPLFCTGGRCHAQCLETRDCATGRCVKGPEGRYCLSEAESHCALNSDCPTGLVCAVDRRCRNECRASIDCTPGQLCADQVCAQTNEVNGGGHLPGWPADAGAADGPMLWGLSRGAHQYRVTAVEVKADGCKIEPGSVQGMTLPVTYDAATATLSIGSLKGSPAMPTLGSGQVANNMATLMRDNVMDTGAGTCSYHRRNVSMVTLFDHDKFMLDGVEYESMFVGPACTDVPAGGACTSTWRWRMELAP
jgi:hypothetical protein